jgi:hypothetical protein
MEVAGVLNIFNHPLHTRGICYTKYLGDGDSKVYQRVVAEKPCGPNISVTKLECIGHVQKRMGARLRRFVKEKTGTQLHDSKSLGDKGRLTQSETDKLQKYYGLAIRRNVNNLVAMKRVVWAIFFTSCQQMRNPNRVCAQVVITVAVNSRTVPVQGLHMNINILYQLLLWMQLDQCSGILLV